MMAHRRMSPEAAARSIISKLRAAGFVALLAGGCVRDLLLGQPPKDYDVVTDATPDCVTRIFPASQKVGAKFGVVIVRHGGHQIEVATFRTDGDYRDGRHPVEVRFGNPGDDARRRDFTINGMFMDPETGEVIDHVGGRADLEAKIIRAIGDPDQRFGEDHLRVLRAVRFAARLGYEIEPVTARAVAHHAPRIRTISRERVRQELELILTDDSRTGGWRLLVETGLANHLAEGVSFSSDQAREIAVRLQALGTPTVTAALACVLRELPPHAVEHACRDLRCSGLMSRRVGWLLRSLPRVAVPDDLELADLKMLLADPGFDELTALLRADLCARGQASVAADRLEARAAAIDPDRIQPPPLIDGHDLAAMDVPQGPAIGQLLELVYRAQLNEVITGRAQALRMAGEWLEKHGGADSATPPPAP